MSKIEEVTPNKLNFSNDKSILSQLEYRPLSRQIDIRYAQVLFHALRKFSTFLST